MGFLIFAGLRRATFLKKRLCHRCFPVNFSKFLKTHFFIELLRWLLLSILKPLDLQRYLCKRVSKLVTIYFISTFLVLVGIFCVYSWRTQVFLLHYTIEVSRDLFGETPHPDSAPYQVFGGMGLVNVEIKRF